MKRCLPPLFLLVLCSPVVGEESLMQKASEYHESRQSANEGVVFAEAKEETVDFGYAGMLGEGRDNIDEHSLFEIGSITKTFTGVLLADLVVKGKVKLEDPITALLPREVVNQESPLSSVTLLQLATHTSGLPRLPPNLEDGADPNNPYAHYSEKELYEYLGAFTEDDFEKPGATSYSNLGLGLLGHLLELVSEKTYEELLEEVILAPLEMEETFYQRTKESIPAGARDRLASAHRAGTKVSHWQIDALGGAGAIVSSAADMMRYASAYWSPDTPPGLKKALELAAEPHSETTGLCWFRDGEKINHDGGTGGFRSSLTIDRGKRSAALKLENTSGATIKERISGDFCSLEGYWTGTLATPIGDLRQVLRVSGEGVVHLHSIDQGGSGIRATVSNFEGPRLTCEFAAIGGTLEVERKDNTLAGKWVQTSEMPLTLSRSDGVPPALEEALSEIAIGNFEALRGYWSGFLGGEKGLFVILRFEPVGQSADIGLYSPDQTDAPLPVTKVRFSNGSLDFRSDPLQATYQAELVGETLQGIWSQGTPLPLELHWSAEKPTRE